MQSEDQKHAEFNGIILKLAQDFINLPINKIEDAIQNAIKMIAQYCSADRIDIFAYDWEKQVLFLRNEWASDPKYSTEKKFKVIPFSHLSRPIFDKHKNGERYTVSISKEHPPSHECFIDVNKTGSMVLTSFPLIGEGTVLGACVLSWKEEENEWNEFTLSSISIFCEMLTSVLLRVERRKEFIENNLNLRLILDSTNDAIMMIDLKGIILDINRSFAKRFGKMPEEVINKKWAEFVPQNMYGTLANERAGYFKKVIATKEPVAFEDLRDGRMFNNRLYPVLKNGQVKAVTVFSTDITDKITAIEEAKKNTENETRMRIKNEFFANMSHEFRTPISVILAQLELMMLRIQDDEKMEKYIKAARQNSYRLVRLVENILDIMKSDAGYLKADLRYDNIVAIIKEVTDLAEKYASAKCISLQFKTKLLGYYMAVDKNKTERIILNLLSNAVKYTQKGGRITVTVKGKRNGILIEVSDSGEGIPKEKQELIFERFVQADASLARKAEGSGIGLSLTKSFVELLRGKIWVKSSPGEGSTFYVELPVQELDNKDYFIEAESRTLQERVEIEFSDIYFP